MKKIAMSSLLVLAISIGSSAFAYQYTEQQKSAMYDLFVASYIASISQQVQAYPLPSNKKQQIIDFAKSNVNKQQLINETWGCVQTKEPMDQLGIQSCFIPWSKKQSADLSEFILRLNPY